MGFIFLGPRPLCVKSCCVFDLGLMMFEAHNKFCLTSAKGCVSAVCANTRLNLRPVGEHFILGKDDQLLLCKVQSKSSFCAVQVVVSQKGVALLYRLYLDWEENFRFDAIAPEG